MMKKLLIVLAAALGVVLAGCFIEGGAGANGDPHLDGNGNPLNGIGEGSSWGELSNVKVTLTLANGFITNAVVDGKGETPAIGGIVANKAPGFMTKNNSVEIDIVSGATRTSNASCLGNGR
jgi:outer membrane lipoprotein SlyB